MPAVVRALRGATTIEKDTPEHITERVGDLLAALFDRNGAGPEDLISLTFSVTADVRSMFPAAAARRLYPGLADVALMDYQAMAVEGSLPRCVRLLAHLYTERSKAELRHVYLEGAQALRPDLAGDR